MTQKLRILLVCLVACLLSQTTFAQYAANSQLVADAELSTPLRDGQGLTNAGKTIMFTGASIAMTGLVAGAVGSMVDTGDDINLSVLYTFIGGLTGGLVTLAGLPFYFSGKHKMKVNGSSLMSVSSEGQEGGAFAVEAGLGLANCLSLHVTGGYNFNKHLFLGGGLGCSTYLMPDEDEHINDYLKVPAYANLRLTAGSKRVTPYMGARLGCTLNGFDLYSGIEFGTNIRSASGSQSDSWWMGVKTECVGLELEFLGLNVGKSF